MFKLTIYLTYSLSKYTKCATENSAVLLSNSADH